MNKAVWLLASLLAACTPITAEQRALQADVARMQTNAITLDCPNGSKRIDILGEGFHIRDTKTVFICTVPLAGGLACSAGQERRVLDFEARRAQIITASGTTTTCSF